MKALVVFVLCGAVASLARPADTDSIESTVKAVYDVISGPAGPRDWPAFVAFLQPARGSSRFV